METVRIINEELSSQISKKLEEMKKKGFDSQILAAIDTAITEKVIPGLQESIDTLENGLTAKLERQSVGLDGNTKGTETGKIAPNQFKLSKNASNLNRNVWNAELNQISNEREYDTKNSVNPFPILRETTKT